MKKLILTLIAALGIATGAQASGGEDIAWDKAPNNLNDLPALQNGAKLFVNYCLNCHSAAFMRYNRLRDIGLSEQQIKDNLLFTTDKVGDTMKASDRSAAGQGMVRRQSARPDPDRALALRPWRHRCRLPVHLPAHLLPRPDQGHRLEQPGLPERRHAARAVGTAGRARAAVRHARGAWP